MLTPIAVLACLILLSCVFILLNAALAQKPLPRGQALTLCLALAAVVLMMEGSLPCMLAAGLLMLLPFVPNLATGVTRAEGLFILSQGVASAVLLLGAYLVKAETQLSPLMAGLILAAFYVRSFAFPFHAPLASMAERGHLAVTAQYLALPFAMLVFRPLASAVIQALPAAVTSLLTSLIVGQWLYFALIALRTHRLRLFPILAYQMLMLPQSLLLMIHPEALSDHLMMLGYLAQALAITGLTLTIIALEKRYGRLDLRRSHGLYTNDASLANAFLFFSLLVCSVPGTITFILEDHFLQTLGGIHLSLAAVLLFANALVAIGFFRAFTKLFLGHQRHDGRLFAASHGEKCAIIYIGLAAIALGWLKL